jgi:hypothetical protein
LAPQTTGEALKGGRLVAEVMAREGFRVSPVGYGVVGPACLYASRQWWGGGARVSPLCG